MTPKEPRCSRPLLSGASFECRSHVSHPRGVVQRTYHEGSHNFFAAPSHYPTIPLSSQPTFVAFIFPSRSSHLRQLVSTTSHTRRHSTAVAHQTHSIWSWNHGTSSSAAHETMPSPRRLAARFLPCPTLHATNMPPRNLLSRDPQGHSDSSNMLSALLVVALFLGGPAFL